MRFGLFPFRSPLLRESLLLSVPEDTEMFHFSSFTLPGYVLFLTMGDLNLHGFPHSDIPGSMPVSGSPRLFAAIHVLLRLPMPRHPSYALISLTITPWYHKGCFPREKQIWSGFNSRIRYFVLSDIERFSFLFRLSKNRVSFLYEHGADRDRTDDFKLAKLALSQLSYTPTKLLGSNIILDVFSFLFSSKVLFSLTIRA